MGDLKNRKIEDKKKVFFVVGGGILQIPFIDEIYSNGYVPAVFDMNPSAPAFKKYDNNQIIKIIVSTKDEEGCLKEAKLVSQNYIPIAVATVGTDFSRTVAKIAQFFDLPGNPYEVSIVTTNKGKMRKRLKEKSVNQPDFEVVSSFNELRDAMKKLSKDFYVIKPVDNMGARGACLISKDFTESQLKDVFNEALEFSTEKNVIIEEYIRSYELSIDAIVGNGEITITGVADRFILNPPYFIELGHLMPSILPKDLVDIGCQVFIDGIKALGIRHGAAKGDIRVRYEYEKNRKIAKGYVGEIASRLSGGFMSAYTFPYSSGINLMNIMMKIAIGEKNIKIEPKWAYYSCELGLVSNEEGVLKSIDGYYEAMMVPYIKSVFLMKNKEDRIIRTKNNVSKLANVISQAPTASKAIIASKAALAKLKVNLY
ncbi:MAG: ATP-grasp domain-containing protein [Spirochaetales bacterium]|nr:ATP-grasp domain-containing protein [Spirochaetales bacterium]